jgi:N6-L-threonylcarbamoyladenine synthase
MINQKNYNFSFSGLKTAVLYFHQAQSPETQKSKEYLQMMAYEIQQAIVDVLVSKTMRAAKEFAVQSIIIGGGVAANETLRKEMKKTAKKLKIRFLAPAPELSVDNAAMAGVSTYFAWRQGKAVSNPDSLQSEPNLSI